MNQKCQNCPKIGAHCAHLRFFRMSSQEILDFCKAKAKAKGWSYERVAKEADVSVGTVSNYFSGKHQGCNYETLSSLIHVLADDLEDCECPSMLQETIDQQAATIAEQNERIAGQDSTIHELEKKNAELNAHMEKLEHLHQEIFEEERAEDRKKIQNMRRALRLFIALFGICFLLIVAGIVIDYLHGGIGFFWLDHMKELFEMSAVRLFRGLI